jgi:hypothetical protein
VTKNQGNFWKENLFRSVKERTAEKEKYWEALSSNNCENV